MVAIFEGNEKINFKKIDEDSINKLSLLFFKVDKTVLDISKLFVFCRDSMFLSDNETIVQYAFEFDNEVDEIPFLIEEIEKKHYCWNWYNERLNNIVNRHRTKMIMLIKYFNNMTNIFMDNIGEIEDEGEYTF